MLFALCLLVLSGSLLLIRRVSPPDLKGISRWALGDGALALGFLFLGLRGAIPTTLSIVGANTIIIMALACYHHALKEFDGQRPGASLYVAVMGVGAAFVYFQWAQADMAVRTVLLSAAVAYAGVGCAQAVPARKIFPPMLGRRLIGGAFIGLTVLMVLRGIVIVITRPTQENLLTPNPMNVIMCVFVFIIVILINIGFMLMCNDRVAAENRQLAVTDSLTQTYNRRSIDALVQAELDHARLHGCSLVVLFIDIDHFKRVNDTYGHAAGDALLREFARVARRHIRADDVLGRYGGEEFLAVLRHTPLEEAERIAERLRDAAATIILEPLSQARVTISIGVAVAGSYGYDRDQLIRRADHALYAAKKRGRNRVVVDAPADPTRGSPAYSPAGAILGMHGWAGGDLPAGDGAH